MAQEFETKPLPSNNPDQNPLGQNPPTARSMAILDAETRNRLNPSGSVLSRFKTFYGENKFYFWAIVLGIVILGILAFFALRPQKQAVKEANIEFSIDAPQTVAAGAEAVYKIKVTDQDPSSLTSLELELIYPDGVSYTSASVQAENSSGTLFKLPDLVSGQNATVFIKTTVSGNVNEEKKLLARLHYRLPNINSDFQKEASATTRLLAADVILEMNGPTSTDNAQLVIYEVHYKNSSDHDLDNARLELSYPEAFSFASGTPNPDSGKNIWNIGRLSPGAEGRISFQGTFQSAGPGSSQTLSAALEILDSSGNYYKQAETSFTTNISSSPLVISQTLQDNSDNVVSPGDSLTFNLKFQNNSTVVATGVNVVITLTGSSLDLSSIQAEGAQISNSTITWNASSSSNLATLSPNDGGDLRFTVRVKNPATKDASKNLTIVSSSKIKSNEYQSYLPGNTLNLKVATIANLDASVEYVSGSLPPKVGKTTVYKITLTVRNSTNDLANAVLSGFIPLDPGSFDSASISPSKESSLLKFDPSTGKLTWQLGNVPAHTGDFSPARKVSFNVRIIPSSSQVNKEVTLFKTIHLTANDSFTNAAVSVDTADVTTSDIPGGFQNGRVVQ